MASAPFSSPTHVSTAAQNTTVRVAHANNTINGAGQVLDGGGNGKPTQSAAMTVAMAVGEFIPPVRVAAQNIAAGKPAIDCNTVGAATGMVGSTVVGGAAAAVTAGTGVGAPAAGFVGFAAQQASEGPIANAATNACSAIVGATAKPPAAAAPAQTAALPQGSGVPDPIKPAQPIRIDTNLGVPSAASILSGIGGGSGGGSMAANFSAQTGINVTPVTSNTAPENRTHHNPNTPQSVVRVGTPAMGMGT